MILTLSSSVKLKESCLRRSDEKNSDTVPNSDKLYNLADSAEAGSFLHQQS